MIRYIENNKINYVKYDKCISESCNALIYAYSWYLDNVSENWDVIVLGDYDMVMPLPHRKKYGIKYIFLPPWVQQLGIFSKNKINEDIIYDFINTIPGKFKMVEIFFNYKNRFTANNLKIKTNYILNLNNNYKTLFKNFSKGRKSNVKQGKKNGLTVMKSDNIESLISLFLNNKGSELNRPDRDYISIRNLVSTAISLGKVKIYKVVDERNIEVGGAIFLIDQNRITYLFSAVHQKGRDKQAMSFLINFIIQKYAERRLILDFEGSMILGIADFFKSFGAITENYFYYSKKKIF